MNRIANCEIARDCLLDRLAGGLELEAHRAMALDEHLAGCAACREESTSLGALWQGLGELPVEHPSPALRARFDAELGAAVAAAARSAARPASSATGLGDRLRYRLDGWLESWWPLEAAGRLAYTGALLVLGLALGLGAARLGRPDPRLGALEQEVRSLTDMVTLTLLEQDSASERLRGASFGRETGAGDARVLRALLDTAGSDPNVNVRLAAIDALGPRASTPAVRGALLAGLRRQSSPLVQIALIDLLLENDGEATRAHLRELLAEPPPEDGAESAGGLHPTAREHLRARLAQRA